MTALVFIIIMVRSLRSEIKRTESLLLPIVNKFVDNTVLNHSHMRL